MEWAGVPGMKPEEWGWSCECEQYVPVMTNKKAAPEDILKVIRCNCTNGLTLDTHVDKMD